MTELVEQILIGSALGDGHFTSNGSFQTGSKFKEWVDFKASILTEYLSDKWYEYLPSQGYSNTPYHKLRTLVHDDIKEIQSMSLEELLSNLTVTGLAVWLYDDGSFHKSNYFYNISTHSFTLQEHIQYILPALSKFGVVPEVLKEVKADGRTFYYTYISKRRGAEVLSRILKNHLIPCFNYKFYDGNINDTLTYKFVKTTNLKTGKHLIHEGLNTASKYIKSYPAKLKKAIELKLPINGYLISYHFYE